MSAACQYCGATDRKITREHVWPEWLEEYMPAVSRGITERWSSGSGRQQWHDGLLAATVRMYCDSCNNGWMADIEGSAKDVVGPMVTGVATTLDPVAQRVVANWAVLKGQVAAQTSRDHQPIPEAHYRRAYAATGAPLNTVLVWIGQRQYLSDPVQPGRARLFDAHFMPVTNVARQFPLPPEFARYLAEGGVLNAAIFQVGHFFALALQHDWPGLRARPKPGSGAELALAQVWPVRNEVRWPPLRPVDSLGNPHRITEFIELAPPSGAVYGP